MDRLFTRSFVLLSQGQVVSQLGNQAFLVAATYFTLEGTGSASLVAIVMMASTLPLAILGPVGGTFADRHSRRSILVATDLLRALAIGGAGLVLVVSIEPTPAHFALLVLVAAVGGVLGALFTPAVQALLPDLVPAGKLASANALMQMSGQTSTLMGQALGGVLYVTWGAGVLLLFDAATFAFAGVSSWFIAEGRLVRAEPVRIGVAIRQYASETREGLQFVTRHRGMISLLATFAGVNLLFMPVFVLLPLYVRDVLSRGPEWYGFLLAASGVGALAGSAIGGMVMATISTPSPSLIVRCVAGIAASVLGLAAARQPWMALAAFVAIGVLSSLINVIVITSFQSAAPTEVRGRVMAVVIALSSAVVPVGMGVGGLLGDLWRDSLPAVFAACGIAIAALVGFAWSASAFTGVHVSGRRQAQR
jgi:MFS family permease